MSVTEQKASTSSTTSVIKVSNLSKRFTKGGSAAIDDVTFEVQKNVVALFGPSGCGKTTTLRCIAGLEKPTEGEIIIDNVLVTSVKERIFVSPEKRNAGLVFQNYAIWPHMKVFDNVAFGLKVKHYPKERIKEEVTKALDVVGLTGYQDRYPAQLSGGQQQRVALARSIVYEPKVLLLDEPLSNLDAKVRERTRLELKQLLRRIGIATIYVTHDQEEAFLLADKIVVMNEGKVMQEGSPHDIYHNPANKFVASFIGRSNLIEGKIVSVSEDWKSGEPKGIVEILGGYQLECDIPPSLKEGDECLVMVRSNEVGLYSSPPDEKQALECQLIAEEYRGAVTDRFVKVGDATLVISTHRFCGLSEHSHKGSSDGKLYVVILNDSVSVVPKS